PGQAAAFAWPEPLCAAPALPVRRVDGAGLAADGGLVRSTGGNPAAGVQAGHPQWDVTFSGWEPLPPADAGTVATTTTSVPSNATGNTISITYTAPSSGVGDASLTIAVPPGWTPPSTT